MSRHILEDYDLRHKPIEYAYKHIPMWVEKTLQIHGNVYMSDESYKGMMFDLDEYFGGIQYYRVEKSVGGVIIYVKGFNKK